MGFVWYKVPCHYLELEEKELRNKVVMSIVTSIPHTGGPNKSNKTRKKKRYWTGKEETKLELFADDNGNQK